MLRKAVPLISAMRTDDLILTKLRFERLNLRLIHASNPLVSLCPATDGLCLLGNAHALLARSDCYANRQPQADC